MKNIETPNLNLINFSYLIDTLSIPMLVMLGAPTKCVEFGLRQAQTYNGAIKQSNYAYHGGC
jgi:nicotinic acid phosphoribosyltransferase